MVKIGAKPKVSAAARARKRNSEVVDKAGTTGHVLEPGSVPTEELRTDLVDPVLSFVVYGVPAPQGSKSFAGFRGGKPILKEQSEGLDPWRTAVRQMAKRAIRHKVKETGTPWSAINVPVMVSAVVTVKETAAATKRGDVYAKGTPDLDKLQRAIGDSISPTPVAPSATKNYPEAMRKSIRAKMMAERRKECVLHDDSLIVVWDHVMKVYPNTTRDSLGFAGVAIQVWLMEDLDAVRTRPIVEREGVEWARAGDLRSWARPLTKETWEQAADRLWRDPETVLSAGEAVPMKGRGITDEGARAVLRALALQGPEAMLPVTTI